MGESTNIRGSIKDREAAAWGDGVERGGVR